MDTNIPFHESFKYWNEVYFSDVKTEAEKGRHISTKEIYMMAEYRGIEKCRQELVEHLSLCPACLKKWAEWRMAVNTLENLEKDDLSEQENLLSYGLLKAAATDGPKGPLSLRSSCGKFTLNLLPQMDDPGKGMITLESTTDGNHDLKERNVTIRDANGLVILDGKFRHGRLARRCDNITDIVLNSWTIVID